MGKENIDKFMGFVSVYITNINRALKKTSNWMFWQTMSKGNLQISSLLPAKWLHLPIFKP